MEDKTVVKEETGNSKTEAQKEKKAKRKEIIFAIVFLFVSYIVVVSLISGGWIIYHDKPYKGQVVDAETGEPIEGAMVVMAWYVEQYGGVGGAIDDYLNAKETLTDKEGRYRIPHMFAFHYWPLSIMRRADMLVYKPGYTNFDKYAERYGAIKLRRARTREERAEARVSRPFEVPTKKIKKLDEMLTNESKELGLYYGR